MGEITYRLLEGWPDWILGAMSLAITLGILGYMFYQQSKRRKQPR
jgi:hypothetical protein